ncbi:MAG: ATP-binding cassette domain-containing protein [Phycisphaerae bacterium]
MAPPLLRVTDLSVRAGQTTLVEGFGVDLSAGELVGVCGPSGCGKTTLLRAIAALDDPATGQVLLQDETPEQIGYPRFRRSVTFVHQQPVLLDASVKDDLALAFEYESARDQQFCEDTARDLLRELRIEESRFGQDAHSLSVGQQQRVCLVRALLTEPKVLLLDEPTSALDAAAAEAVTGMLRRLADQRGLSALVVAHDVARIKSVLDRVIDLQEYIPPGTTSTDRKDEDDH